MKDLNNYIIEKLLISKNTPKQIDYSKFGEGIEKKFSECKIYKKYSYTEISDYKLKVDIDKYFNDDDNVFVITEIYTDRNNPEKFNKKLNDDFRKIIIKRRGIWQHVYLLDMYRGYYFKILDDVQILVIKDFYKNGNIKQIQYIIKLI